MRWIIQIVVVVLVLAATSGAKVFTASYGADCKKTKVVGGYCEPHKITVRYNPEKGRLTTDGNYLDSNITFQLRVYDQDSLRITTFADLKINMEYSDPEYIISDYKEVKYIDIQVVRNGSEDSWFGWSEEKCHNDTAFIVYVHKDKRWVCIDVFSELPRFLRRNEGLYCYSEEPKSCVIVDDRPNLIYVLDSNKVKCKAGYYGFEKTEENFKACHLKVPKNATVSEDGLSFICNENYFENDGKCDLFNEKSHQSPDEKEKQDESPKSCFRMVGGKCLDR